MEIPNEHIHRNRIWNLCYYWIYFRCYRRSVVFGCAVNGFVGVNLLRNNYECFYNNLVTCGTNQRIYINGRIFVNGCADTYFAI